ncbi:MAG: VOC family protein [Lachnospiraceae bacterium]|jgi:glyoxalase/bleomycin resistance protein/dioxygenase superfamily|nr:VOC family protein [Lachnospiraceae bacterium]
MSRFDDLLKGVQHLGVPTNDLERTIRFYERLGFEVALRTLNEKTDEKVAFLRHGNLMIETYENHQATMKDGAIDHIAIDVTDIEKCYEIANELRLDVLDDGIQFLPFWENGVKFFTVRGPNNEKVEFNQQL